MQYHIFVKFLDNLRRVTQHLIYDNSEGYAKEIFQRYLDNKDIFIIGDYVSRSDIKSMEIFSSEKPYYDIILPTGKSTRELVHTEVFNLFKKKGVKGVIEETHNFIAEKMVKNKNKTIEETSNKLIQKKKVLATPEKQQKEVHADRSNKIFIVHGHDEAMKLATARTIEKLNLDPIILHEKPNKGLTIIEKFTEYAEVSFAIVLLSPDDLAYQKDTSPDIAKYRARQNVIFELGYFIGKLGRMNVVAIYRKTEDFEIPNDYSGVIWIPYDSGWALELVKELKACNFDVDANKLLSC